MLLLRKKVYRFFRRALPSLETADHEKAKRRLSIVYMIAAWHAFGAMVYLVFKSRASPETKGLSLGEFYASASTSAKSAEIITVSGFTVSKREIDNDELAQLKQKREQLLQ